MSFHPLGYWSFPFQLLGRSLLGLFTPMNCKCHFPICHFSFDFTYDLLFACFLFSCFVSAMKMILFFSAAKCLRFFLLWHLNFELYLETASPFQGHKRMVSVFHVIVSFSTLESLDCLEFLLGYGVRYAHGFIFFPQDCFAPAPFVRRFLFSLLPLSHASFPPDWSLSGLTLLSHWSVLTSALHRPWCFHVVSG